MDRREFLTSTGMAAAAGVGAAAPALATGEAVASAAPGTATPRQTLRLALQASAETSETGAAAHLLARRVATALDDDIRIDVVRVETSGADAVRSGIADFYYGFESHHAHLHPAFAALGGMPLGEHMDPIHHYAWLMAGDGGDAWDELSGIYGIKAFAAGHTGASQGLDSERILERAADLQGLRIACDGLARDVVAALGAEPVAIDWRTIDGSISALGIDAIETLGVPNAAVAHWRHGTGLMPGGMMAALGMRRGLWAGLSSRQQIAVEAIAGEAFARSLAQASLHEATVARISEVRRWPVATAMPHDLVAAIEAASRQTLDRLAGTDPLSGRIVASYRSFRSTVSASSASTV